VVAMAVHKFSLCFLSYACNLEALVVLGRLHILNGEHERIGLHFLLGEGYIPFFVFVFFLPLSREFNTKMEASYLGGF